MRSITFLFPLADQSDTFTKQLRDIVSHEKRQAALLSQVCFHETRQQGHSGVFYMMHASL